MKGGAPRHDAACRRGGPHQQPRLLRQELRVRERAQHAHDRRLRGHAEPGESVYLSTGLLFIYLFIY